MYYASGSSITNFPTDGIVIRRNINNQGKEIINNKVIKLKDVPILGLYSAEFNKKLQNLHPPIRKSSEGRIVVYGDSSCLDSAHLQKDCFWMLEAFLQFTTTGTVPFIFQHSHQNLKDNVLDIEHYDNVPVETPFANKTSKSDQLICSFLDWEKPIIVNESLPNNIYKAQKSILLSNLELSNNILPDVLANNLQDVESINNFNKLERNSFKQMLEYESSGRAQNDDSQVNYSILTLNNFLFFLSILVILYLLNNLLRFFKFSKFTFRRRLFSMSNRDTLPIVKKRRKISDVEVDSDWLLEETKDSLSPSNTDNNI